MADDNMVMSESDISALRETLCAQQKLLQKLYNELDAEREASATAASEALSVILRLQGEKAAIKMESEQYKRLSEQKISHAEESLAIIEDIIYSKEMEVAALDHQLQAYHCKLLSMGCVDEIKLCENPPQRSESLVGESSRPGLGRRNSATLLLKHRKASCDMDLVPDQTGQEDMFDQVLDMDRKVSNLAVGDINSYWEEIRRLGERVKEIAGVNSWSETRSLSPVSSQSNNIGNRTRSPSPISFSSPYDSNTLATVKESEEPTCFSNYTKRIVAGDCPSSPSVHDVFEVPQVVHNFNCSQLAAAKCESLKRDVVHPEAVEVVNCAKKKPQWLKKKALKSAQRKKRIGRQDTVGVADSRFAVARPRASVSESLPGLNQVNRASEIIEVERPGEHNMREEELKLLNEIKEEINSLREEVRSWKVEKSPTRQVLSSLTSLQEGMLYFWL